MSSEPNLHLFTIAYPYGDGETFLENELMYLSKKFNTVYLYPANNSKLVRPVPSNVLIRNLDTSNLDYSPLGIMLGNFGLIVKAYLSEIFKANRDNIFIKHFREFNSRFCRSIVASDVIHEKIKHEDTENDIFYSFWMNGNAEALAVLKYKNRIKRFVFRANGFDLYDVQARHNYIPFRPFIFKQADKMFAVAMKGRDYMRSFALYPEKITYNYFGTQDHGISVFRPEEKFTIFTCSDLRKIKRVDGMIDILKYIDIPLRWIHHGHKGDNEAVFYEKIKSLPANIEFVLHERKEDYNEVLQFFKNNHFNLFVLLSSIEGLPVSLIEAISFGIPVLATDVGGVSEVISAENGILIEKDFKPEQVAEKIAEFSKSNKNAMEFRKQVRATWEKKFSAIINYEKFYQNLIGHELN